MSATTANPFLKTLISNTCVTSSFHIPSIFNPRPLHFSISSKHNKISISSPPFSLQNQTFLSSRVVSYVAQTSDWGNARVSDAGEDDTPKGFSDDAKLFVGNLSYDVDSEKLALLFQEAGVVEISEVIYNRETETSRGFGFVTMSTVEEAAKAAEMFNGYELNGRSLTVNIAAARGSRPERQPREFQSSFRVYVGNLSWDVDDASLQQLFSEHGKVLSARVISDRETVRSRGFGFVTMASEAEMNDAIAALDGQTVDGRAIRVNVAEERPRRNSF